MLDVLRTFFAIVLVFGLVIFIHELGHFLAAKAMGVYAPRFSIGFGPAIWSRKWGETEYVLASIPLGGYVRMASREDESMAMLEGGAERPASAPDAESDAPLPRWYDPNALAPFGPRPVPEHRWFESKSLPARLLIMLAGVTMNMVLGLAVLIGLRLAIGDVVIPTRVVGGVERVPGAPQLARGLAVGDTVLAVNGARVSTWNDVVAAIDTMPGNTVTIRTQRGAVTVPVGPDGAGRVSRDQLAYALDPSLPPVVDEVAPETPADSGGLQAHDSVVAVDGHPVRSWIEVVNLIEPAPGRTHTFDVVRNGTPRTLTIHTYAATDTDPVTQHQRTVGKIGAYGSTGGQRLPISVGAAITSGWSDTWGIAGKIVGAVRDLATGKLSFKALNGPIGIGRATAAAAKRGWADVLYLVAFLSIDVAVLNLLPVPILDGGQIVMNVVETVKGSALSTRTREYLLRFGLAALALLFVIVMYNDITSWVRNLFGL